MNILGIDAGATKSHVVLWNEAQAAAFQVEPSLLNTKHPGLNLDVIASAEASARLRAIIEEAARVVERDVPAFLRETQIVLGMAGLDTDLDRQNAQSWLDQTIKPLSDQYSAKLLPDVELALWAANDTGTGVLLIAGTGSNCFARSGEGKLAKAGGLSHFFSDEGSGFMLGWEALHRLAQMFDARREKTALFDEVLKEYAQPDFPHLKRQIVQSADYKHEVAKAAPAVQRLAAQGEPDSLTLIEEGTAQLALMVQTVLKQLGNPQLPIYLVGGLFQHELYRDKLNKLLADMGLQTTLTHIEYPVLGALRVR